MTEIEPVRYGIIGSGMMGIEHIHNLAVIPGTKVVAIADPHVPSQNSAIKATGNSELKIFNDHKSLLNSGQCDVLIISSPNFTHAEILLDILKHPKPHHVLVEKPMCTTIEDCKKVIHASEERPDVIVQVGLEYRYMPPVARLISEVKSNSVGKVRMVAIREHRFPFLVKVNNWNRFSRNTGGTLVEKCCHFFDLMNLIIGADPVRVMASGSQDVNHLNEVYDGEVPDILDNAFVIVEYGNGCRAMLDLCMFAEGSRNEQELSVTGDVGKLEALVPEGIVRLGLRANGRPGVATFECTNKEIKYEGLHHGSSYLEHLDFLDVVKSKGQKAPLVGLKDGLMSVSIGVAAHRAIELGHSVSISDVLS